MFGATVKDHETASVELSIKGKVSTLSNHVVKVEVSKQVNKIARAQIWILDGDVALQKFELFEQNSFDIGDDVIIKIGGTVTGLKQVFKGVVSGVASEVATNNSFLVIHCADKALGMTKGRNTKIFLKKKDDAIIKTLIGNTSGLTPKVDACTIEHEKMVQYGINDWDFMLMRAEANGFLVFNSDAEVAVKEPTLSGSPTATYSYGKELLTFENHSTGEPALTEINFTRWDYDTANVKTEKSDTTTKLLTPDSVKFDKLKVLGKPTAKVGFFTSGIHKANQFKDLLNGKVIRSLLASQKGQATVLGDATVLLGDIFEIKGLGKLGGKFFCSGIEHTMEDGLFTTTLSFGIDEYSHWERYPSLNNDFVASTVGTIHGIHLGTVMKLDGDPNTQMRIQVKLPVFGTDALVWARLTFPDAGKSRGIFFVPEKNDEVAVSFIDGDPNQPIILGTLYNKSNTAPYTIDAKNNKRAIISKNKVTIEFDDEKKNLTLKTPGGNSILFDDAKGITMKDKNGNSIELGSAGITIKSSKEVKVSGLKGINLAASGGPVKIAGLQVEGEAKTTLKLAGKATAEVSAAGILTLKGGIVKIN